MIDKIKNQPLIALSVGELLEVLLPALGIKPHAEAPQNQEEGRKYVYGVAGLAKLLGCSIATAQRRISSGVLDKCIIRNGRLIMIDREAAIVALKGGKA